VAIVIERLSLTNFRNHADLLVSPAGAMVVLTGENGAGKTNVLEAVSLLGPGRGLRAAPLRDMARADGPGGFGISARWGTMALGCGTDAAAPDRRIVRIDGKTASASGLAAHLALVWLTPAMDRLFMDSPGGRRRFLDRLVLASDPAHATHTTRYEAAMRARNSLLTGERAPDTEWLNALEAQMGEHGAAVAEARTHLIERLGGVLATMPDSPFARPQVVLAGWQGDAAMLRAAGRALTGPHRDDLLVTHVGKGQEAARCSTGEQKALLLSIILAHAALIRDQTGRAPVMLLDEVAAHLDPGRRLALFGLLRQTGGQVWMTGTEEALFEGLGDATRIRLGG
jgi:DNA replication and repair protein RecF